MADDERATILERRARFLARALASAGLGAALSQACAGRQESEPTVCLSVPVTIGSDARFVGQEDAGFDAGLVESVALEPEPEPDGDGGALDAGERHDEEDTPQKPPRPRPCLDFVF